MDSFQASSTKSEETIAGYNFKLRESQKEIDTFKLKISELSTKAVMRDEHKQEFSQVMTKLASMI